MLSLRDLLGQIPTEPNPLPETMAPPLPAEQLNVPRGTHHEVDIQSWPWVKDTRALRYTGTIHVTEYARHDEDSIQQAFDELLDRARRIAHYEGANTIVSAEISAELNPGGLPGWEMNLNGSGALLKALGE